MEAPSLTDAVRRELLADPEVTEREHRFGGIVFHLRGHEIGHIHADTVADLPLPPSIRDDLVAGGRVARVDSDSDWVSRRVNGPEDVEDVVGLFRLSYEHAAAQPPRITEAPAHEEDADPAPGGRWRDRLPSLSRRSRRR